MDQNTPREILNRFYLDNNLSNDGGNSSSSVKIQLSTRFHFYFPNFDARREAVLKHDIHHLLTNYDTSLSGESEISAWEIASGCRSSWAAFMIDTSGLMFGLPFNYYSVLKAFARGRKTRNLYHNLFPIDAALDMEIRELRKQLYLDRYPHDPIPTFTDFFFFTLFIIYGGIYSILLLTLFPLIIFYTLYVELKIRLNST